MCKPRRQRGLPGDSNQKSIHSLPSVGGATADALLGRQTSQTLRTTLAPKLDGAVHLSAAAYGRPVLSCAYFSSIAALLGNAGQTTYAASNAALDGLAQLQQAQASQTESMKGPGTAVYRAHLPVDLCVGCMQIAMNADVVKPWGL